jgi:hypothetical protein
VFSAGSDGVFQSRADLKPGKNATTAEDAVADGTSRFFFRSWEYR